jgi:hypothetical protein
MPYLSCPQPTNFRKQRKRFVTEVAETKELLHATVLDTGLQLSDVHLLQAGLILGPALEQ